MITVSQKVGRLAEIRMTVPISMEDVSAIQREMSAILDRAAGRIVACVDMTGATVFPEDLAERISKLFRENHRLERTAIVVDGATIFLQIERLLRVAGNTPPSRPDSSRDQAQARSTRSSDPFMAKRASADPLLSKRPGSDPHMSKRASERRAFRTASDAIAWLDEVLTSEEHARLRMFLEGPRAQPASS